jgi:hypothetical protein
LHDSRLQLHESYTFLSLPTSHIVERITAAMKVSAVLLAATSAASASAAATWMPGGNQAVINDAFKVPGDNPLYFCEDPKSYILDIENVDLDPNPPLPYVFRAPASTSMRRFHVA